MSFKNLQLPDLLIAELYNDVLVETNEVSTSVKKPQKEPKQKWFLGENKKHVVIAVKDDEAVYLRDEWLQFLSSILIACKLNLGDVAIINYAKNNFSCAELSEKLSPEFLLMLDVTAKEIQLPFTVPHYQIQKYNQCSFLLAPSLQTMQGDTQEAKLEKSKLWLSLKKMFNI
ncbi:MAG: hypothetical protein KGL19_07435 [Bacteroidota bacterium]|nr:hypothetical protein [Bacteroidota bacterium]